MVDCTGFVIQIERHVGSNPTDGSNLGNGTARVGHRTCNAKNRWIRIPYSPHNQIFMHISGAENNKEENLKLLEKEKRQIASVA